MVRFTQGRPNRFLTVRCYLGYGRPSAPEAHLALTGSHYASSPAAGVPLRWLWSRLGMGGGEADHRLAQRLAGTVFMIRVASARPVAIADLRILLSLGL